MSPTSTVSETELAAGQRSGTGTPQSPDVPAKADPTLSLRQLGAYAEDAHLPTTMSRAGGGRRGSAPSPTSAVANRTERESTIEPGSGQLEASSRFVVLQKWEGTVLDSSTTSFTARLIDLTGERPDHEATIRRQELSPRDRDRVVENALFYWYIGYRDSLSGERERASKFYFRRLPPVSDLELERARQAAGKLRRSLGWH
jgi:hypothetical protein